MASITPPNELRNFWKLFEKWAYRHDYGTVFDDFLTMSIPNFSFAPEYAKIRDEVKSRYNQNEIELFSQCFFEMINVYKSEFQTKAWYDFFGELYQAITSNFKASNMGQFFTPEPVCDMIVRITNPGIEEDRTSYVNDPACGSGRMLIASDIYARNTHKRQLYLVAQDVDSICCKMTVLNFVFHGCKGEVLHMNSLSMDYYNGYKIFTTPACPIPQIAPILIEQSSLFQRAYKESKVELPKETLFDLEKFETTNAKQFTPVKKKYEPEEVIQESLF